MSKHKKSESPAPGKLFVVSAPSGAGKTTLVEHAVRELGASHKLSRVITYTTKSPRLGDISGVDYYFITRHEFEAKIAQNFFLEYSDAYGEYYGTSREMLAQIESGDSLIAIVDKRGALAIKQEYNRAIVIWINPPSIEVLRERLESRGTESSEKIANRLELAKEELASSKFETDEKKIFDYILVNDDLTQSLDRFKQLLVRKLQGF